MTSSLQVAATTRLGENSAMAPALFTLLQRGGTEIEDLAYRKRARDRIETNVDLVHEIGWVADTHKRASTVHIVLPCIQLFITLKS